jgi:hypothetical protein
MVIVILVAKIVAVSFTVLLGYLGIRGDTYDKGTCSFTKSGKCYFSLLILSGIFAVFSLLAEEINTIYKQHIDREEKQAVGRVISDTADNTVRLLNPLGDIEFYFHLVDREADDFNKFSNLTGHEHPLETEKLNVLTGPYETLGLDTFLKNGRFLPVSIYWYRKAGSYEKNGDPDLILKSISGFDMGARQVFLGVGNMDKSLHVFGEPFSTQKYRSNGEIQSTLDVPGSEIIFVIQDPRFDIEFVTIYFSKAGAIDIDDLDEISEASGTAAFRYEFSPNVDLSRSSNRSILRSYARD